ncbi:unnamed protein product, partial [Ectocarpus sp. 8 AP-2014]
RPPTVCVFPLPSASGPPADLRRRGRSSSHASPCQSPVNRGQNTRIRPASRRYQHPNKTPPCPLSGLDRERGRGGCSGNVYGRRTTAAAALGSAAAVAADAFSSEEPSSHPQRQQEGRGSFPSLSPSNSVGVAPFDSGLPSSNMGGMGMDCPVFQAKRGAGGVLDGGNGGKANGLGDCGGIFGARHSVAFVAEVMVILDIAWTCAGHAGPNGHHLEILSTAGTVGQGRENGRGAVAGGAATIATATATATATSGVSSGGGAGFCSPSIPASRPANPAVEGNRNETNNSAATTGTNGHSDLWAPYRATGLKLKVSAEISPDKIGGGGGGGGDRQSPQGQRGTCVSRATSPVPVRRTISSSGGGGSLGISPVHGGTLKSVPRNNGSSSGDDHARRPNSFPRSKPLGKEDKKDDDDDAGGSDTCSGLRAHRHQRADSDGPLRPRRWRRAKTPEAAGHGNVTGSGFLSDMMRRRSRTVSDKLEEQVPLEQAGARRGDKLSIARQVFDGGGGEVEALAGRSSTIGSRSNEEGGGSVGGGGEGEGEGGREHKSRRQPFPSLSITADDDNETAGSLPGFVELDSTAAAGGRFSGPASCPSRPSGCQGEARDSFNGEPSQGEREEHVFGQGFWIALRLDLIQWFMPLPIAGTAAAATDDFEAEMSSVTPPGENSRHGVTGAASSAATTSTPQTAQRTTADVPEPTEDPEEATILKLVESVSVRASVRGLALATWRGADNRDGFALDIDSIDASTSSGVGDSSASGGKHVELRLYAVRLSRLDVALDDPSHADGRRESGEGGESVPLSPPSSGRRRLSRLWIGRRQSYRDSRGAPRLPTTPTHGKGSVVSEPAAPGSGSPMDGDNAATATCDAGAFGNDKATNNRNAGENQSPAAADVPPDAEGLRQQPKLAAGFLGNRSGRIRSAAKLVIPPPAAAAPPKATGGAGGAASEEAVTTPPEDASRSPRRGIMKNVGFPRRRASCASPSAAKPPSKLGPTPPLSPCTPLLPPRPVTATSSAPDGAVPDRKVAVAPPPGTSGEKGVVSNPGETNLVVLDGLRLVWTLEIRDSVFLFISDAVESFTTPPCASHSGEEDDSAPFRDVNETASAKRRAPAPDNARADSAASGLSRSGRWRPSSFVSPSQGRNGSGGGGVTARRASDPGNPVLRLNAVLPATIPEGTGGGGGGGGGGIRMAKSATSSPIRTQALSEEACGTEDGGGRSNSATVGSKKRSSHSPGGSGCSRDEGGESEGEKESGEQGDGSDGGGESSRSPCRFRSTSPGKDTEGGRSPETIRTPAAFVARSPDRSREASSAGSELSFMASPATESVFSPRGGRREGNDDPNSLLHWLNENFNQPTRDQKQPTTPNKKEDIHSSSSATAAAAASSGGWVGSPAHGGRLLSSSSPSSLPRDNSSVSPRQSGSPRGESKGGVFIGGETTARAGGSNHGGGGGTQGPDGAPGKRHIEFEVHLGNPQIKLLGDNASLILCAEGADVEARTYGTWGVVSSSPASPGASAFRSGYFSSLRRKDVKVKLEKARVFSLPVSEEGLDRWVEHGTATTEGVVSPAPRRGAPKSSLAAAARYSPPPVGRTRNSPSSSGPPPVKSQFLPTGAEGGAAEVKTKTGRDVSPAKRFFSTLPSSSPASPTARTAGATLIGNGNDGTAGADGEAIDRPTIGAPGSILAAECAENGARRSKDESRSPSGAFDASAAEGGGGKTKGESGLGGRGSAAGSSGESGDGGISAGATEERDELREVMRHFSVDALYVYHETLPLRESQERFRRALSESSAGRRVGRGSTSAGPTGGGRGGGGGGGGDAGGGVGLKRVNRPPVNRLRLDVPELSSDLDSRQFFEVLDVVNTLLLVPPPLELRGKVRERKRQRRAEGCIDSEKVLGEAVNLTAEGNKGGLSININSGDKRRSYLKDVVEETLRSWARSNSNNTDINAIHNPKYLNTGRTRGEGGPIPPQASSGCTSPIAAAAATSSTVGDPAPTATAGPASTTRPETNPTTATANLSCPVTPPRIRMGGVGEAGGRNPTSTAGSAADGQPRELTRLEYRIGKCTWRLTMGPKTDQKAGRHSDQMEVGLTGLSSTHNYLAQGGQGCGVVIQNVMFQIERLWVRSLAPAGATNRGARGGGGGEQTGKGKASRSQSVSSSPVSAAAVMPRSPSRYISSVRSGGGSSWTGVGREGRVKYDSRSVLSPTLLQDSSKPSTTSVCTSCKQRFNPEENAWDSCRIHCDSDGEDGVFVIDGVGHGTDATRPQGRAGRWSCCGSEDGSTATGCTARPHKPKEIMISIRADGGPPVLVGNTEAS